MKKDLVKTKIDLIQWLTCPHCKKVIMQGNPEMVGQLLKWRKQSDKKIVTTLCQKKTKK